MENMTKTIEDLQASIVEAEKLTKKKKKAKPMANKNMLTALNAAMFGKSSNSVLNSFCMIFDAVDEDVSKQVIQFIIESTFSEDRPDILNILINSPGGQLHDAFAIIDVMKSCPIPIRTIGLGQISSAGLMIFLSGTKGERVLTPNTSIMSHQWSGGSLGKSNELWAAGKEFDLTDKRMMNHYMKTTGLSEKKIREHLLPAHDVYLSSSEALKFGICDKVANLD